MILKTERFDLRTLDPAVDDLSAYLSWMRNAKSNPYIRGIMTDMTLEDLHDYVLDKNSSSEAVLLGIFHRFSKQHIGNVKLEPIVPNEHAFVGILIGEESWRGKGAGFEVLSEILHFCFSVMNLEELMLGVDSTNHAAYLLYHKLGFREIEEQSGTTLKMLLKRSTITN